MDGLKMGNEYYDENGIKFKFIGINRKPIEIRYGGFIQYIAAGPYDYIFQYETNITMPETFNPQRVFNEDIKDFKFGVKCQNSYLGEG